jgi:homoserine O-acetyltransferase
MSDTSDDRSVGIVTPQTAQLDSPLLLQCGQTLPRHELVYETYGELNADRSNAILVCHALSGDHHAAGKHQADDKKYGWWHSCIGPGKAIDSDRYFIVSSNNLGGCRGSSGPMTINPDTGEPFGPDFPIVTCKDWVQSQKMLMEHLGIDHWAAVVGGSLGAMQAMQWAIDFPELVDHILLVASAAKLTAQNTAFNEVARQAIRTDPHFYDGRYYLHNKVPERGLMLARMLGHITYLSEDAMSEKFGRELRSDKLNFNYGVEFQVESYLRYQGESFVNRFDANTYLLMTKALDYFDPAADYGNDLVAAFKRIKAKAMVISFTSDWRFSTQRSEEIVDAMMLANCDVSSAIIEANQGHDSFLLPIEDYVMSIKSWLNHITLR